jgi:DNA-binding CsgD family transcriptional regulator
METYAYADAASLYGDALAQQGLAPALTEAEEAAVRSSYGRALQETGLLEEALTQYARAASLFERLGDGLARARVLADEAAVHLFHGESAKLDEALHTADEILKQDAEAPANEAGRLRVRMLHLASQNHTLMRRYARAEEAAQEAMSVAQELRDDGLVVMGYSARAYVYLHWLRPREALEDSRRHAQLAESLGDPRRSIVAASRAVPALIALGRLDEAAAWLDRVEPLRQRLPSLRYFAAGMTCRALLASLGGEIHKAADLAADAFKQGEVDLFQVVLTIPLLSQAACYQGDFAAAERWTASAPDTDDPAGRGRQGQALALQALVRGFSGDLDGCRKLVDQAIGSAPARRPDLRALAIDVPVAEASTLLRDRALAERQIMPLQELHNEGVVVTLAWPALVTRLLGAAEAVAGHWDDAERHLKQASSEAEEIGARAELGRCYLDMAALCMERHRRGDLLEARGLVEKAAAVFEDTGMTSFVRRAAALSEALGRGPVAPARARNPAGLSGREVEVLRLLAVGKSNREIAEALVLSQNTVLRHVSSILTKTGTANRTQAAAFANREGLV